MPQGLDRRKRRELERAYEVVIDHRNDCLYLLAQDTQVSADATARNIERYLAANHMLAQLQTRMRLEWTDDGS